jgi:hypothetical protein
MLSTMNESKMILNGLYTNNGVIIDDNMIRLLTWVIMDATIVDDRKYNINSIKMRIQFKLSKDRKIKSLTTLLDYMGVSYTLKPCTKSNSNILQPYYVRIYGDDARKIYDQLCGIKEIPSVWRNFNCNQVHVFLDTLKITDGCDKYHKIEWRSTNKVNVDIVFEMCIKNNIVLNAINWTRYLI